MQDDKKQDLKSNLPKRKALYMQNSKKARQKKSNLPKRKALYMQNSKKARQKKSKIAKTQDNKKAKGYNAMQ